MKLTIYEKIDRWLTQHEEGKYTERGLDAIADYICWAAQYKKITDEQISELTNRICKLYER